MNEDKSIQTQLAEIVARLAACERQLTGHAPDTCQSGHAPAQAASRFCSLPVMAPRVFGPKVSTERARAIISLGRLWANGITLHYYFFTSGQHKGEPAQYEVVRRAFAVWKNLGIGLNFVEVNSRDSAEVRIGFNHGDGSWSYIGRDVLGIGPAERTMNFGWDINVSGSNGLDTAIHEIGHTLGLNHEHQSPNAGIVWDTEAVYRYFNTTQFPPWEKADTDSNILNKIPPNTVGGSNWDPDSIMHYAFDAGLIIQPDKYRTGLRPAGGLSENDRKVILHYYPGTPSENIDNELKIGVSKLLSIAPGDQRDFIFNVPESRKYTFQTFGQSDSVMVLFEEDGSRLRFVAGDDDSGEEKNALIRVRLIQGRRYHVKIRLFHAADAASLSVMVS